MSVLTVFYCVDFVVLLIREHSPFHNKKHLRNIRKCVYNIYRKVLPMNGRSILNNFNKSSKLVAGTIYFFFVILYVTYTTLTIKAAKAIISAVTIHITSLA